MGFEGGFSKSLMNTLPLSGVAVALLIPRTRTGRIDTGAYEGQLRFLLQRGVEAFVLNGATSEYILTSSEEFRCLLQITRRAIGPSARLVAGIGSPNVERSCELASLAAEEGANGILLPMPYFFPYGQEDLLQYVEAVAKDIALPIYLYNLPAFTSGLAPSTSLELIGRVSNVVGIKDSSGSLETVSLLRREAPRAACILGYDGMLHAALAEGVCDGIVSGVSCVLPELMLRLYEEASRDPSSATSVNLKSALDEFLAWLGRFPIPWGLKIIGEARGLGRAYFPMPLSSERQASRQEFLEWFGANREMLYATSDENVS